MASRVEEELPRLSLKDREELENSTKLCLKTAPGVEGQVVRIKTNFYEVSSEIPPMHAHHPRP